MGKNLQLMDAEKAEEEFPLLGIAERTFEDEPGTVQKRHTEGILPNSSCPPQVFHVYPLGLSYHLLLSSSSVISCPSHIIKLCILTPYGVKRGRKACVWFVLAHSSLRT